MVGARKESRLWGCLNLIDDVFKVVECCKAFKLSPGEEDKAVSLWEQKRRRTFRRVYNKIIIY